jgi:hypothetical protein
MTNGVNSFTVIFTYGASYASLRPVAFERRVLLDAEYENSAF